MHPDLPVVYMCGGPQMFCEVAMPLLLHSVAALDVDVPIDVVVEASPGATIGVVPDMGVDLW